MKIIYLVQGRARELQYWRNKLETRQYLLASWDEKSDISIYIPNTTWAEGRKILYEYAQQLYQDFDYVVFIDGDALLKEGSLDQFEENIINDMPCIALPWCDKLNRFKFLRKIVSKGGMFDSDELFQGFSRQYLIDNFDDSSPYNPAYDNISWWLSCIISQAEFRKTSFGEAIIYSDVYIVNSDHSGEYNRDFTHKKQSDVLKLEGLKIHFPLSVYMSRNLYYNKFLIIFDYLYVTYTYLCRRRF